MGSPLDGRRAYAGRLEQVVEDLAERTDAERQVPVLRSEMDAGAGDVRGEPLPVRDRHHEVLPPLPDGHRHADLLQVEPPVAHEREVVVEPSPWPVAEGRSERGREALAELPGNLCRVDVGDEGSQLRDDLS